MSSSRSVTRESSVAAEREIVPCLRWAIRMSGHASMRSRARMKSSARPSAVAIWETVKRSLVISCAKVFAYSRSVGSERNMFSCSE